MNNKGKGSGLVLIILLLVTLLIGYLAMTQMEGPGFGKTGDGSFVSFLRRQKNRPPVLHCGPPCSCAEKKTMVQCCYSGKGAGT